MSACDYWRRAVLGRYSQQGGGEAWHSPKSVDIFHSCSGPRVDGETNTPTASYQNQTTRESSSQANGGILKAGNDVLINGGQVALSHTKAVAGRDAATI